MSNPFAGSALAGNPFADPGREEGGPPARAPAAATAAAPPALSLPRAMTEARRAVALFTELPVDAVASCARTGEGWSVVVDVVEVKARMGDNDLLAAYEVTLAGDGEVAGFRRIGRYLREEARGAAPGTERA